MGILLGCSVGNGSTIDEVGGIKVIDDSSLIVERITELDCT